MKKYLLVLFLIQLFSADLFAETIITRDSFRKIAEHSYSLYEDFKNYYPEIENIFKNHEGWAFFIDFYTYQTPKDYAILAMDSYGTINKISSNFGQYGAIWFMGNENFGFYFIANEFKLSSDFFTTKDTVGGSVLSILPALRFSDKEQKFQFNIGYYGKFTTTTPYDNSSIYFHDPRRDFSYGGESSYTYNDILSSQIFVYADFLGYKFSSLYEASSSKINVIDTKIPFDESLKHWFIGFKYNRMIINSTSISNEYNEYQLGLEVQKLQIIKNFEISAENYYRLRSSDYNDLFFGYAQVKPKLYLYRTRSDIAIGEDYHFALIASFSYWTPGGIQYFTGYSLGFESVFPFFQKSAIRADFIYSYSNYDSYQHIPVVKENIFYFKITFYGLI